MSIEKLKQIAREECSSQYLVDPERPPVAATLKIQGDPDE